MLCAAGLAKSSLHPGGAGRAAMNVRIGIALRRAGCFSRKTPVRKQACGSDIVPYQYKSRRIWRMSRQPPLVFTSVIFSFSGCFKSSYIGVSRNSVFAQEGIWMSA